MTSVCSKRLALAIYLNSRGLGFVLFDGPAILQDWGVIEARGDVKRERMLGRISVLFSRYKPDIVILQDMSEAGTRRPHRIRRLNEAIIELAERYGLPMSFFSRFRVRQYFSDLSLINKDSMAAAIAKQIPALDRFLPPPRKIWKSEDARMAIFDAAGLVLAHFRAEGR